MGKRMLATRRTLDRLRSLKADRLDTPRKRPTSALLSEMNTRLRAFGVAVTPANPWDVLFALFPEVKRAWSTARIAAYLDVDREGLSTTMARLTVETAHHDGYVVVGDMIDAIKRTRLAS